MTASVILALVMCTAGCKSSPKQNAGPTSAPAPDETWTTQALAMPPQQAHPAKEGRLPLAYMVESATTIRVVDATSNQDLLRLPVPAHTIVGVDAKKGVTISGATMKLGPLPSDHNYSIYLESSEENVVRSGTIRPGRPAKPAVPSTQGGP